MGIQVEELTRNLMPWKKEFIDFSFAGRHISEFGLVAVSNSNRYQFNGSPEFESETTTVNGVAGQYYWGTRFKTRSYDYELATDGMTERQFDDFKKHFRPGNYGQFYEDTWFDRYCYVRVQSVVSFSFMPFQEEIEVLGTKLLTRVYRGECKLKLIQDRPFSYSFQQVLDSKITDLKNHNDNTAAALRMLYHSNIPARDSWIGNKKCATGSWYNLPAVQRRVEERTLSNGVTGYVYEYVPISDTSNLFNNTSQVLFYNPSTIPTECKLEFTLNRAVTELAQNQQEWEPIYFDEVQNALSSPGMPYNTITSSFALIDNDSDQKASAIFKYSLPEVPSEINKAIEICWRFYQEEYTTSLVELQERLQEELVNSKVMIWATYVLQQIQSISQFYARDENDPEVETGEILDGTIDLDISILGYNVSSLSVQWYQYFNIMMLMMLASRGDDYDTFGSFYPYTLKFDGSSGRAFVSYKYNTSFDNSNIEFEQESLDENCSNIVMSNYLELDGGDTIDVNTGYVKTYHVLSFNHGDSEPMEVDNIRLDYQYTYV